LSMTPQERRSPELLDMNRKRRIARGSGTSVNAVNELLKQFEGMRRMMGQLKQGGLLSRLAGKIIPGMGGKMPDMDELMTGSGQGISGVRTATHTIDNDARR